MTDLLLEIGRNPNARKLVKTVGLPIPIPVPLTRARGPMEEQPLAGKEIAVAAHAGSVVTQALASALATAGASPWVHGDERSLEAFKSPGEAYGRPAKALTLDSLGEKQRFDGLVFDATTLNGTTSLRSLYDFFHPLVGAIGKCGRAVVIGRPPEDAGSADEAAARSALDGFVRSLSKEIGKTGSTANLVYVQRSAEDRLAPLLRFLLSARSAFFTGQPLRVTSTARAADPRPLVRPLAGKVALVTGAARGIGAATAELLAAEGAHVVCLDRPADDGPTSQVARKISGSTLLVDITDPGAPAEIAKQLGERHGGVDVVVHNAGITRDKTLLRMKPELWDSVIDVNLGAVVRINEALIGGALRPQGRIVCLSSVAGIAGNMGQTNYAASKAGLVGYVRHLAAALGKHGTTVNAIAPGFIETRLTAAMPVMIREAARRLSSLGQGGQPEDVAQAITFLATPGADGLTGNVVRVCGGALVGA